MGIELLVSSFISALNDTSAGTYSCHATAEQDFVFVACCALLLLEGMWQEEGGGRLIILCPRRRCGAILTLLPRLTFPPTVFWMPAAIV